MLPAFAHRFSPTRTPPRSRGDRGGALIEFALAGSVFLAIVMGIVGFGHALYAYHFISHAAREASRYAAVRGYTCGNDADGGSCQASNSASGVAGPTTNVDLATLVKNIAAGGINTGNLTVTSCGVSGGSACTEDTLQICTAAVSGLGPYPNYPGCFVGVQVGYTFHFIVPLISTKALTMSSSSYLTIIH